MSAHGRFACMKPDRCCKCVCVCMDARACVSLMHDAIRITGKRLVSQVIGLFRRQEGAPSSEEETQVLSRIACY